MDSQKSQIPINTRTVGNPRGSYILYIEDYVHTYMRKLFDEKKEKQISNIALYGKCVEENGVIKIVVSGAASTRNDINIINSYKSTYFLTCDYIGMAFVSKNDDNSLRLEIKLSGTILIIEDFYIYYSQNEEMQNYLIDWNLGRKEKNISDDVVRYSRVVQAYNKEDAKIKVMWNFMNLLGLSFAVCILVYSIININNYNKMQNMQQGIEYCMRLLDEQSALAENTMASLTNDSDADGGYVMELETETEIETISYIEETDTDETEMETEYEETVAMELPLKYYIVQKGDTLRNISYEIYGDYLHVDDICEWNDIENADNILCGQRLLLH